MVNFDSLLENWNISKFDSINEILQGNVNKNWIIKVGSKKFVLKEMEHSKNEKDLLTEFNYLENLRKNNFPYAIPKPLPTNDNKLFVKLQNTFYWLYIFIDGVIEPKLTNFHLKEIAKMVAIYHKILESGRTLTNNKISINGYNNFVISELQEFLKSVKNHKQLQPEDEILIKFGSELEAITQDLNKNHYNKIELYPIHRDLGGDNLIWSPNELKGVIDFENVSYCKEPLVKDLSVIISFSCRNDLHQEQTDYTKMQLLLTEYKQYKNLSFDEIKLIPDFIINGIIEDFNYAYWLFKHNKAKSNIERLERYAKSAVWHFENKENLLETLN